MERKNKPNKPHTKTKPHHNQNWHAWHIHKNNWAGESQIFFLGALLLQTKPNQTTKHKNPKQTKRNNKNKNKTHHGQNMSLFWSDLDFVILKI